MTRRSGAESVSCQPPGDVVIVAVPWGRIDDAVAQAGPLDGRIVIDTTNQFAASGVVDLGGETAARHNSRRLPGARYTKSFNTLTAGFQAATAGRGGEDRAVQLVCGDDDNAKAAVIAELGYCGVDLGGLDDCAPMEAPRRSGAVYGEEYRADDAAAVVEAVRRGAPVPPTPTY